jgi:hypothetical protein
MKLIVQFYPTYIFTTPQSKYCSQISSDCVIGYVLHPYKTKGKSIVLYILILTFWDSRPEDKSFWTEEQ